MAEPVRQPRIVAPPITDAVVVMVPMRVSFECVLGVVLGVVSLTL